MNCDHHAHETEERGHTSLKAATYAQVPIVFDGLAHAGAAVYALGKSLESGHAHESHKHHEHVGHEHHGHTHSPVADIGWAGLSGVMLAYLVLHNRSDKKKRARHEKLQAENSALEKQLAAHDRPIPDVSAPSSRDYTTLTERVLVGAGAAGQVAHTGAHVAAGGVLLSGAMQTGLENYVGIAAAIGSVVVAGSLTHHLWTHRKTEQHYRGVRKENARLRAQVEAIQDPKYSTGQTRP